MRARLRDFVMSREGLLFAVADYVVPGARSIPALLRYVPGGEGQGCRKVSPPEASAYLRTRYPEYRPSARDLHRVPVSRVARHLPTRDGLSRCGPTVQKLAKMLGPPGAIGVTGSHLCGLAGPGSDVDLVAYGPGFEAARRRLRRSLRRRAIRALPDVEWDRVYEKRRPPLSREEFLLHERRKGNRGLFQGRRFDLLYVRDWPEIRGYRPWRGRPAGARTLRAPVLSVERPFDIPTLYRVAHPDVGVVMGFRHDFVDQVRPGELLEARGRVEVRGGERRLVVGKPGSPRGEWVRSLTLLEQN